MRLLRNTSSALKIGSWILLIVLLIKGYEVAGLIVCLSMFLVGAVLDFIHMELEFRDMRKNLGNLINEVANAPINEKKVKTKLVASFERLDEGISNFDLSGEGSPEDIILMMGALAKAITTRCDISAEEVFDIAKDRYINHTKMVEK